MFELLDGKVDAKFSWDSIGDVKDGRSNLGEDMPVFVYRLLQFTLRDTLSKRFGSEVAVDVFRKAGELSGKEFAENMLDLDRGLDEFTTHLQEVLRETKIGILCVEHFDLETGAAVLTVSEDLDCSGLPVTGDTVCNYDEGFLAGILQAYTKKPYVVSEVDCWATGSRVCRFNAHIRMV